MKFTDGISALSGLASKAKTFAETAEKAVREHLPTEQEAVDFKNRVTSTARSVADKAEKIAREHLPTEQEALEIKNKVVSSVKDGFAEKSVQMDKAFGRLGEKIDAVLPKAPKKD